MTESAVLISQDKLINNIAMHISSTIERSASRIVVVLTGEGGTGKTTVALRLREILAFLNCEVFEFDSFAMDRDKRLERGLSGYSIEAFDLSQASVALRQLCKNGQCWVPHYSHETGKRCNIQTCSDHHHFLYRKIVNMVVGVPLWCQELSWLSYQLSYFFEYNEANVRRTSRISIDRRRRGYNAHDAKIHFQRLLADYEATILPSKQYCSYLVQVHSGFMYSMTKNI